MSVFYNCRSRMRDMYFSYRLYLSRLVVQSVCLSERDLIRSKLLSKVVTMTKSDVNFNNLFLLKFANNTQQCCGFFTYHGSSLLHSRKIIHPIVSSFEWQLIPARIRKIIPADVMRCNPPKAISENVANTQLVLCVRYSAPRQLQMSALNIPDGLFLHFSR